MVIKYLSNGIKNLPARGISTGRAPQRLRLKTIASFFGVLFKFRFGEHIITKPSRFHKKIGGGPRQTREIHVHLPCTKIHKEDVHASSVCLRSTAKYSLEQDELA